MKKRKWAAVLVLALSLGLGAPVWAAPQQETTEETVTHSLGTEEFSQLLDFVREKWDAGELESAEDIRAALEEGEQEFEIDLNEKTEEQLVKMIDKVNDLGLDHEKVMKQAEKLYETYGDEIAENLEEVIREELAGPVGDAIKEQVVEPVKEAAEKTAKAVLKNFWQDLKNSVVGFVKGIFHLK